MGRKKTQRIISTVIVAILVVAMVATLFLGYL